MRGLLRPACATVAATIATAWLTAAPAQRDGDPFEFFRPSIAIDQRDLERLAKGAILARTLPSRDGNLSVFAAVQISADGDRLVEWMEQVAALEKGRVVEAVARISARPSIDDFQAATLEDDELDALKDCRVGDCGVKLTAPEIGALTRAIGDGAGDWKARAQEAFRRMLLARAEAYLSGGGAALGTYADHDDVRTPFQTTIGALLESTPCLVARFPDFAQAVAIYPADASDNAIESFLYWSKARLNGKPLITMTHVNILRTTRSRIAGALIVSKQIFADHYITGSLSLMTIVGGPEGPRYLAYLNHTNVDVIHGVFGGLTRMLIEHHLRSDTGDVVGALKRRIEIGPPPTGSSGR